MEKRFTVSRLLIHLLFICMSLLSIIPMLILISTSLSSELAISTSGYGILPKDFTIAAYKYIFSGGSPILRAYMVTTIVTIVGTILHLIISSMLAYGISRKEIKYRGVISFIVVFCLLFSGGIVPTYILVMRYLHLGNNIAVMFIPYLVSAVYIIMMRNFFMQIPESLIESARIDGSGEFYTFVKIVVPLSKPIIATIALFVAVFLWNDWTASALYIDDSKLYGLQFLLQSIMNNIQYLQANVLTQQAAANLPDETARMASSILAVLPILIGYPFLQNFFVKGLTIGAVKE